MSDKTLNVVYIGSPSFPIGAATSKRRRYMVDYMNSVGIKSHYLVCDFKQREKRQNDVEGVYGLCDYRDITPLAASGKYFKFWREGKAQLRKWLVEGAQNVLVFPTILTPFIYPFYRFGRNNGYKIVFDQVETSYLQGGGNSLMHELQLRISEYISAKAYRHSSAFVISKNLWNENHDKYPDRKLCLLPNSTPQFCESPRKVLNRPLRLLYSGTYAHKDGVKYLLEGVVEAHEAGCDIELSLLGKGTAENMKVLDLAKDKDYIKYLGFVTDEELRDKLLGSDVLCMTRCNSRFANYGFPFKLSEYLATGNVVLATSVGDVCDYVENGKSAYIVPPEDSHAIARAIKRIYDNPDEAASIARGGLDAMKRHFSINGVGKTFVDFLQSI